MGLRSIGCCVSVVGLRLVIRWRNLLESVVGEFIVIFVNSLTRVPLATTDDILLWLADECGESLEFANKRKGGCYRGGNADYGGVGASFNLMWETRF